jgi:hypothetical protein
MTTNPKIPACKQRILARSALLRIEHCVGCDCVALHFGPITLRFDVKACESLLTTLADGLSALEAERAPPSEWRVGRGRSVS